MKYRFLWTAGLGLVISFVLLANADGAPATNFFINPSFELGRDGWNLSKGRNTQARFTIDNKEAADGQQSALISVDSVEEWGVQFGQSFVAGSKGKTYTFAVVAKSVSEPVGVSLSIERSASPWDRAMNSEKIRLSQSWQELHVTFKVAEDFAQGWFAYISCVQPKAQFRVDLFRLYEGPYVPYKEAVKEEVQAGSVRVFDSGSNPVAAFPGTALAQKTGWAQVAEDTVAHKFKGAAVLMNDRLACVLRRGAAGVELYSVETAGPELRAVLSPVTTSSAATLSSVTLVENSAGQGIADAVLTTKDGKTATVRCDLRMGQPVLETEAREGIAALRVEAPCRFAVLPDFFADDIVIDAAGLAATKAELPSDNFLLHLLPGGQAMVMTVVKTSEEDIKVSLAGEGAERQIASSEIRYGKDGKMWVAVLTGHGIWHEQKITKEQAGKITRLDWKTPFPAQWRIDWRREQDLSDSWEMLTERMDGRFSRYGLFGGPETLPADRKRWTTVLGTFPYPAWIDKAGQGYVQPLKSSVLKFEGPAVIYPLTRLPNTALETFTVVDVVRNTLGVGPCEYILDVEGQQSNYKGRATCSVRDTLNPIYANKQQIQKKAEIEQVLKDLIVFIRHIRGRIEGYVSFGHETLEYLAGQKKAHPELTEKLAELEKLARIIDRKVEVRRKAIKTPEEAAVMVEDFRKTVLTYEGEDAHSKCKRFTEAWVEIGGNQDELVGECRWAVKMIRQRAGLLMAQDARLASIAKELRLRSQTVLRNPANHEGARH